VGPGPAPSNFTVAASDTTRADTGAITITITKNDAKVTESYIYGEGEGEQVLVRAATQRAVLRQNRTHPGVVRQRGRRSNR
jgi:hypothetical protein